MIAHFIDDQLLAILESLFVSFTQLADRSGQHREVERIVIKMSRFTILKHLQRTYLGNTSQSHFEFSKS